MRATNPAVIIRDVWAENLDHELEKITQIIEDYPYVSMDTEFPGVVARPVGTFRNVTDYNYQTMRCNVDLLKMIQLGLTFSDNNGNSPPECSTWQFNFKMSLTYLRTLTPQAALTSCVISQRRYVRAGLD